MAEWFTLHRDDDLNIKAKINLEHVVCWHMSYDTRKAKWQVTFHTVNDRQYWSFYDDEIRCIAHLRAHDL